MTDQHLLGPFVRRFLLEELIRDHNLSLNTQRSYRDTLRLLFNFMDQRHHTAPAQVTVEQLTAQLIRAFLAYLEQERGNVVATRNQRLAALHAFFHFVSRLVPELVAQTTEIQAIPPRRALAPAMAYLEKHESEALLAVPQRQRPQGRRDYALLLFLYNTGARASEVAGVTIGALSLGITPSVRLLGKGRKTRTCPLWPHTADTLRELLGSRLGGPGTAPVFLNVRGQPITRFGIYKLVVRNVAKAAPTTSSLRGRTISPHSLRHTTAVHLLRAGVDINTIRAWLGHVSLETTNSYAEADLQMKAKALESCAIHDNGKAAQARTPLWRKDTELMSFLASL